MATCLRGAKNAKCYFQFLSEVSCQNKVSVKIVTKSKKYIYYFVKWYNTVRVSSNTDVCS